MSIHKQLLLATLATLTLVSCQTIGYRADHASSGAQPTDNTLTAAEKEDGWKLMFDGKSVEGWKWIQGGDKDRAGMEPITKEQLGAILNVDGEEGTTLRPFRFGGYLIVYEKLLENFVIQLDFQLNKTDGDYSCNSGIFFRIYPLILQENPHAKKGDRPYYDVAFNGIEVAIDQTPGTGYTDTGALYDLARPLKQVVRPNGQWNHLVLTNHENLITITLNGELVNVVDFDRFKEGGKKPNGHGHKFGPQKIYRNHPRMGYFGIQDHGCPVRFKNIKLLDLD